MQELWQENQFQTAFWFFQKILLCQVKANCLQLDFTICRLPSNQHTLETNCLKFYTVDPEICSVLIFQIRVWEQFLQHILCIIFHQKCFSCCILSTDQISLFWLPLLLEILGNMCIAIVCEQGCDVKNFRINLIFLIKPFLYMNRKSRQELKYLENEKSF